MIVQSARVDGRQLPRAAVKHCKNVLPGQAGGIEQAVDIGMLQMNRSGKRAPRRVVSGVNRIRRRTDSERIRPREDLAAQAQRRIAPRCTPRLVP